MAFSKSAGVNPGVLLATCLNPHPLPGASFLRGFSGFPPCLYIRKAYMNLPVKPSRPHQGWVQNIRPVGCRNDDYSFIARESVHFNQELVQVCSLSSLPPPSPAPLLLPTASISSMNMMQGAFFFAWSNKSLTLDAPHLRTFQRNRAAYAKKGTPASPATDFDRYVFLFLEVLQGVLPWVCP